MKMKNVAVAEIAVLIVLLLGAASFASDKPVEEGKTAAPEAVLSDGFVILESKMEQGAIPRVDLGKIKSEIPQNLPAHLRSVGGYLWSGFYTISGTSRGNRMPGVTVYFFLAGYDKDSGEMKFFRAWERGMRVNAGWHIMTGKADTEQGESILLRAIGGYTQTLLIDKAGVALRGPEGYEARLSRIGTIVPR